MLGSRYRRRRAQLLPVSRCLCLIAVTVVAAAAAAFSPRSAAAQSGRIIECGNLDRGQASRTSLPAVFLAGAPAALRVRIREMLRRMVSGAESARPDDHTSLTSGAHVARASCAGSSRAISTQGFEFLR